MQTMLQDEAEITAFVDLLKAEGVRSYLEVGAKFGGALARVGAALPDLQRAVAVDLPGGTRVWRESKPALEKVVADLKRRGCDARVIWGDSTAADVIAQVKALGPFDAILIDANHTLPYVQKDWQNYGPLGRLVAFHDIAWRRAPEWVGVRIDVPQFWDGVKQHHRHAEFRHCPTGKNNGIGVLWREDHPVHA